VPGDDGKELYARVKAVTENEYDHPLRTDAPEKAEVDWTLMKDNNERICLRCDPDSFDPKLACVYLPITSEERQSRRKKYVFNYLYFHMICQAFKNKSSSVQLETM